MVRSVAGDPPRSSVVALCFAGAAAGLNAPFTLRQIDEAEFEQRLNAVWQRDSSEARQLMEDPVLPRTSLPSQKSCRKRKICWKVTTMRRSSN
ncbi:hypothetical protein FA039_21930 [Escherichia coli]|nr:hypothetical protein [Escherichia coli]